MICRKYRYTYTRPVKVRPEEVISVLPKKGSHKALIEVSVIGDEVNLTSRIEAQSLRGQILISENTYRLAKSYVLAGEPNKVQVKGKREPVCLYDLMGTKKDLKVVITNFKNTQWSKHKDDSKKEKIGKPLNDNEIDNELDKLL